MVTHEMSSETQWPRVGVVVLNWNAASMTRRCVESLLDTEYPTDRLQLVIVDNASVDGSTVLLKRWFPEITLLENDVNVGFAEGCNRGMRHFQHMDAVALVNNDATVDPGWLRPLAQRLLDDPTIGAVAPKMLLATPFIDVDVHVHGTGPRARLVSATSEHLSLTSKVLGADGTVTLADDSTPLATHIEIAENGRLSLPVASPDSASIAPVELRFATARELSVTVNGHTLAADKTEHGATVPATAIATVAVEMTGPSELKVNSLGTALTQGNEGYERRLGESDSPAFESEEVQGWSGGGVLLRRSMLNDVGLFDSKLFAYYEDTDLSWRARNRGWRTVTEPSSVIAHHLGASAGSSWNGFFFLNYRNWLITTLRNGSAREIAATMKNAWAISWPFVRRNVTGKVRRLQRPDLRIASAWARVWIGVARLGPPVLARRITRRQQRIGTERTDAVGAPTFTIPTARPPAALLNGSVMVYIDVTETLRSGWKAGIQRVVLEFVKGLLDDHPDLDLVLLCWSAPLRCYRRLTTAEVERLLSERVMENHPRGPAVAPRSFARRAAGRLARTPGLRVIGDRVRSVRDVRNEPTEHLALRVERFNPGSVFFDVDASWNLTDTPRSELYPKLAGQGVRIVTFTHDILPITNREWFSGGLPKVFAAHIRAGLEWADLALCNSHHTAEELAAFARQEGRRTPPMQVIRLGTPTQPRDPDTRSSEHDLETASEWMRALKFGRVVLCVGTIEPRKNHTTLLDAFEQLGDSRDDLMLVIAGRAGWETDAVVERLRHHPLLNTAIFWPERVSDAELEQLYRKAWVVVTPSLAEGFGLPLAEALAHGCAVLASDAGAHREVGGDCVTYFDPTSTRELANGLLALKEEGAHTAALQRGAAWEPSTWQAATDELARTLGSRSVSTPEARETAH
jgi:GT2 family glycosyltransferase/glycosyltransferase involved in cell wall biosynthesis